MDKMTLFKVTNSKLRLFGIIGDIIAHLSILISMIILMCKSDNIILYLLVLCLEWRIIQEITVPNVLRFIKDKKHVNKLNKNYAKQVANAIKER